ncbi:MAG: 1-deoxy-D-xylulose-5-phosphate reductoisomerase [Thermomicrobiales bacterium]
MNDRSRQNIVVLGSTGSVGRSTLDVVAALPERFNVLALAAASNQQRLQEQIERFRPSFASCLAHDVPLDGVNVIDGADALTTLATLPEADIVVVATTGHAAIIPTIEALKAGKIVALANKEVIVAAGEIVTAIAREGAGELRPVDSEHSALWQCLGANRADLRVVSRLILTASGGPFRGWTTEQLRSVTPALALSHPTWSMGAKITIDSATLMNKGLEMIEARWLFECPYDRIEVVVHPQSLVHSLVEYVDGSTLAQLASHDMRIPIQYALTYPDRLAGPTRRLRLTDLVQLDFEPPNLKSFPLLEIARQAGLAGGAYPTVLSTADTVAVNAFLTGALSFTDIATVVTDVLDAHAPAAGPLTLDIIAAADEWAEQAARQSVARLSSA